MAEEKKNIPKLRFREFTGDNANAWELRKLGEIAKITTGKLDANALDQDGIYDFYTSGIKKYHINSYSFEGPAITIAGNGATVGYMHLADGKFDAYQRTYVLTDFDGNRQYLFENIGLKLPKKIKQESRTGSIPYIVLDMLTKLLIDYPSINEQQKIGSFFKHLDELLTLHQRMLDEYKTLKKTMLSKMFPKNGEKYPELRFSGFTDAWELRKLGEVARIVGGGTPKTSIPEYWNGEINWYSPVEIGKQTYVYSSQKKITELGLKKSSAKILPVGTILFTSRAGIGNTAILSKEATTNQGFQSIVPDSIKLDSYFIYSRSSELKKYGEKNGAGSTFIEVSGKEMEKMPIYLPKLIEQQKIGSFFKHLDELITLHQRELDLLKTLKKTMLQQMFV